jgi:hypothetical protein
MQKAARKMPDKMRGDVFTLFYCRTAKAADKIVSELNELFGRYDILHVRKTGDTQVISHYRSLRQN